MPTRKINVRITDKEDEYLSLIKKEIHNDSDSAAMKYAIGSVGFRLNAFAPPLPDSVRNFTRPAIPPELPVIEPGGTINTYAPTEAEIKYEVDEYSSAFKPPRK